VTNLKVAFRTLFKSPFVTSVAILSLALGLGANVAIFSLFNQVLLRPLPVADPARLVNLASPGPKQGSTSCNNAGSCEEVFSYAMFRDLERVQTVFSGLAAHRLFDVNLSVDRQTVSGSGLLVSGSYFPVLGVQPALGRLLGPADDTAIGEAPVVVLGFEYWQNRLGGSPAVLDRTMSVNGQTMTIVGVAGEGFNGTTIGARPAVFVPLTMRARLEPFFNRFDDRKAYWAYLFARLKPGVSLEQAGAALNVPYHAIINDVEAPLQRMSEQTMARFRARQVVVTDGARGQSEASREARAPLNLLLGVTGIVLLIACANIANLLLARGAARAGEMSVRLAIGASRWQLVAQLLTESCVLAAFGGVAGLLVARWTLSAMVSLLPAEVAATMSFGLDRTAILFTTAITFGTGLLFGLFPALHSTRPDLIAALKGQAGQPSGAKGAKRFRATLATVQIALSMALLVSAGLFTRSLFNVSRVDLGLKIDNVITFTVSPDRNGYTVQASRQFFERLEDELAALPGVTGVADSVVQLLSGSNWGTSVKVQGFQAGPDTDTDSRYNEVGPAYFQTLGVPLIAGREFTRADAAGAPKVAIVNEAFAGKFDLGRDVLGKRISSGRDELDTVIVGFVRNAKYSQVKGEIPPVFFRPYRQSAQLGALTYYIRTSLPPEQMLAAVPKAVAAIDPNLPVKDVRTMPQQVRENVFLDRFISVLSAAFAGLATLLAAVGLYGVLAYTVAQRTREIGLRMALGAAPGRVRAMILGQLGMMTLIGGTIGLAAAVGLGRLAQSMLYELHGSDPIVLSVAVVTLSLVALGAGFIPAHRASRVDPMRALRYE
jgi:predicted permease